MICSSIQGFKNSDLGDGSSKIKGQQDNVIASGPYVQVIMWIVMLLRVASAGVMFLCFGDATKSRVCVWDYCKGWVLERDVPPSTYCVDNLFTS